MQEAKKMLSNTIIIFIGTVFGSVFSYLYNMLMGRMLGPDLYGQMSALLSLFLVISVGGGAITTVAMKYANDFYHNNCFGALNKLFSKLTKYMIYFASALFILGIIFSSSIAKFFSIDQLMPVFITTSCVFFGYVIVINRGILQGTQKFTNLSITNTLEMLLKLVFGVALVKIGFSLNGAIGAIVLSTIVVYFVTFYQVKKVLKEKKSTKEEKLEFNRKEIFSYSIPSFISTALLVVAMNLDVIMVNHFFPGEQAGYYSACSTVAKIILYVTAPIISVMFPMISERKITGAKHYQLLLMSLLLTILGGLIILGIYTAMPAKIISILYGSKYTSLYHLLPEISLAVLFYSLINLLANYYLAIKDYIFLWFFAASSIISVVWISISHPSIQYIVRIIISSFGFLFFLMMAYYLYTKRDQLITYIKGEYGEEA